MGRKNDTAVFTVIFPGNTPFLAEFAQSLRQQTDRDFDLVVMNESVENIQHIFVDFSLQLFPSEDSIAKTRQRGIEILLELGYSKIIFADSDDRLSQNRVEVSKRLLEDYDLLANDLDLMDKNGAVFREGFWKDRKELEADIRPEFIIDKNIFGLGNSAVRSSFLDRIRIPEALQVVDWYIFKKLFKDQHKAVFTTEASTHYRIRAGNLGSYGEVTPEAVRRCLKVKSEYYLIFSEESELYRSLYGKLQEKISGFKDRQTLNKFVEKRSKELSNPFWWEEVLVN